MAAADRGVQRLAGQPGFEGKVADFSLGSLAEGVHDSDAATQRDDQLIEQIKGAERVEQAAGRLWVSGRLTASCRSLAAALLLRHERPPPAGRVPACREELGELGLVLARTY
jgi:hypothetical protein